MAPRKTNDLTDSLPDGSSIFLNRELQSLAFNQRVMEEAQNKSNPLLERVKFLSIASANMDEFSMVRVAGLRRQVHMKSIRRSDDGRTATELLDEVLKRSHAFMDDLQKTWRTLRDELKKTDIEILHPDELTRTEKRWLAAKFELDIFPVLTPLAIDPAHPFPFLPNKELAISLHLRNPETGEEMDAVVPVPSMLERFIRLPSKKKARFVQIERAIVANLMDLFAPFELIDFATFRVLRDSELEIRDDAEDLIQHFEQALQRRRRGHVIQLMVNRNISVNHLGFLKKSLNVQDADVFKVDGLIGLSAISELFTLDRPDLMFKPYVPRHPERVEQADGDIFAAIRAKDFVVHHPYESFDVVVKFLEQAAADPDVVAIKQTLYRTSKDSPIVRALISAALAGKSVTAMIELKARFDEEANLRWARDLERAGVKVVFGFTDLKTHAKMSLVVRNEGKRKRSYAHFGTGNYHPVTAKVYTDLSYFTCDPDLCADMTRIFNYMTGYAIPRDMNGVAIAPLNLRSTLYTLIDNEIAAAKKNKPSGIWIKINNLLDPEMIRRLYAASQAGVPIELVIRGICTLRPGISGLSDNIQVKSVVGRFLEHSRIYCFANGDKLPSRKAVVYISSADLMPRNLDFRIETLVPITNETVHEQILEQVMLANLKDVKQSWTMDGDGKYSRERSKADDFNVHDYFMTNPSLSGRGAAITVSHDAPPKLAFKRQRIKETSS